MNFFSRFARGVVVVGLILGAGCTATSGTSTSGTSTSGVRIADIARLQGERRNVLVGHGLVFGLKGTGDGGAYLPTMRPRMEMLKNLHNPVSLPELSNAANVAMVMVTVELPSSGVRNGDNLDVKVMSSGVATSLKGGHLIMAPLFGSNPELGVFGQASGDIDLDDISTPTRGIIRKGATIDVDLPVKVIDETGHMTLVLDGSSAHRITASTIARIINDAEGNGETIATALDGKNVVVAVPRHEQARSNDFISRVLQLPVCLMPAKPQEVVNRKTGSELTDVLLRHSLTAPTMDERVAAILASADKPADENLAATMQAVDAAEEVMTNNLANAQTTGYRAARVEFTGSPLRPQVTLNMEPGAMDNTNSPLDVAIVGCGFFRVKITPGVGDGYGYTRAGNFFISKDQQLVVGMGDGYRLDPQINIPPNATGISISNDGRVDYLVPGQVNRQQAGTIKIANFINPNGLKLLGGNIYQEAASSGPAMMSEPGKDGIGILQQGFLEGSNVDVRKETLRLARLREWRQNLQSAIDMIVSRVRGNTSAVGMLR